MVVFGKFHFEINNRSFIVNIKVICYFKSFEELIFRIEKQRDEVEEERLKDIVRRMNDECEEALKRQWKDAEEFNRKAIIELRVVMRKELLIELQDKIDNDIRNALDIAEVCYKILS